MIDFSELIEPTVEILKESENGLSIREIDRKLEQKVRISEADLKRKHCGGRKSEFSYRAAWARTYLKKYGLIQNPERGIWKISSEYTGEPVNAGEIVESVRREQKYRSQKEKAESYDAAAENRKYIEELANAYKKGKIALFLGAGVSMAAEMPSWNELISRFLIERFKDENEGVMDAGISRKLEQIAGVNKESSPLMQTRFVKQNLEPEKYLELLMKAVYQTRENIDNELFESLTKLIRNKNVLQIREIITYNFDDLLEKKMRQKEIYYESYDRYLPKKSENSVKIYHVHGYLDRQAQPDELNLDSIVFSEEQYHKIYEDTYNWSNMQQINMLREKTCLFLGCSLSDPNLRRLADIAHKEVTTRHYAILKKEKLQCPDYISVEEEAYELYQDFYWNNRNAYYNSLGIYVIWVDEYSEIPEILRKIRGEGQ